MPRLDFDDMPAPGPAGTPVHLHLPGGGSVELAGGDDEVRRLRRALSREALTGGRA
ncbi:MAG: hypothetical protein U5P41_07135 [Gammaproteobacteria bacterium]|nr:hypothetical protein [Gammaproteobacteria bacterium]